MESEALTDMRASSSPSNGGPLRLELAMRAVLHFAPAHTKYVAIGARSRIAKWRGGFVMAEAGCVCLVLLSLDDAGPG